MAIPISGASDPIGLRVGVLIRPEPESIQGQFISIGSQIDAKVVLGCLLDANGSVHDWLKIAIQDADRIASTMQAARGTLNNRLLDQRWHSLCNAENQPPHGPIIWSGWELKNPLPMLIDPQSKTIIHPVDVASGHQWRLCVDDGPLQQAGLPPYSSSLHRYLWVEEQGSESRFVPVTAQAPSNDRCIAPAQAIERYDQLVPLNLGGGLIKVSPYLSVRFEDFSDVLSGQTWQGVRHGRESLKLDHQLEKVQTIDGQEDMLGAGWLFQDQQGQWGRLIETMHLKLRGLTDAMTAVHDVIAQTKTPLLNIASDHFHVRLDQSGCGLPYLWTARTQLSTPGCAFALPIEASEHEYFLRTDDEGASIYRPASASSALKGNGTLRIRELIADTEEQTILTATLTSQQRIECARNDLIWLRMELRAGHFDLFAHLEEDQAMATGEMRLRTIPLHLTPEIRSALNEAAGVPIENLMFELLPLLSTPHDLYAMAVLGARTLLVDESNSLPVALDELMSLARQVGVEYDEDIPLAGRIETIFQRDPRWLDSIGPHRLTRREITPQEALDLIPDDLWHETLGLLIRMLPGMGSDSICRDFADAPLGGLQRIFKPALEEFDRLLRRTRSLIVIDWRYNREISGVLRRYATGLQGDVAGMIS
ncbi:MAG: hypothetical protein O7G85_05935 [Planctomycetota bacterium]|nr:hypothetical protein [Planctomycetota bacterium]